MKTLKFTMEVRMLDGFNESEFIHAIKQRLEGLEVKAVRYGEVAEGYRFEVDFEPLLPGFTYQPILWSC